MFLSSFQWLTWKIILVSGFSYKENNYNDDANDAKDANDANDANDDNCDDNDDANADNFQVREAYRVFDKERVGHITADELRSNENLRFQCNQWKLSKKKKES